MSVRAKFRCVCIEDYGLSKKVKLTVVNSGADPMGDTAENRNFTRYTPNGEIWMTIDNPHASVQFEPNEEYYVTFEPAKAPVVEDE